MNDREPEEAIALERILAQLRDHAAELDPAHARLYSSMAPHRWLDAADLTADLLIEHWGFKVERRRRGRREHNAAVYALLQGTNAAQLVAAVALVHTVISLLANPQENE